MSEGEREWGASMQHGGSEGCSQLHRRGGEKRDNERQKQRETEGERAGAYRLALEHVLHRVELAEHLEVAQLLRRRDEGPAHVRVPEEAQVQRARSALRHRLLVESERSVCGRLGDGDDDGGRVTVGHERHWVLAGQLPPKLAAHLRHVLAEDARVLMRAAQSKSKG
eukprot:23305-Rhodomonas_salina.4